MFAEGAPDVAVGFIDVVRATITQTDSEGKGQLEREWNVSGWPIDDGANAFILFGDLVFRHQGWFIGVTAVVRIASQRSLVTDEKDIEEINRVARRLGSWACHVLYDTAAMRARSLVASSLTCDLHVPEVTLEPNFQEVTLSSIRDDDDY